MNISRRLLADYVNKLHQKACRTCSTIIFPHSANQVIDLWRCRFHCGRRFFNPLTGVLASKTGTAKTTALALTSSMLRLPIAKGLKGSELTKFEVLYEGHHAGLVI